VSDRLPPQVAITELLDGVRYRLPGRPWGLPALLGLGAVVAGLVGTAFMSFWLWAVGSNLLNGGFQAGDGIELVFLAAGGWMLLMLVRVGIRGLSRLVGHNEIELRDGTLRGLECWGPVRWGRKRAVDGLVRFDVRDALPEERPGRVYEEPRAAAEFNVLTAVWDGAELSLARGYPRDWLVPLAADLARRCEFADRRESDAPAIPVAEEPLPNPAGFVDLLEQPVDSRVVVEQLGAELRLTLPRATFGRQHTVLTVAADRLRVEQHGGEQEWTRPQLADVRVARLIDSEGPDTFQVHIDPHPGEGQRVRLASTGEAEARWLATILRRVLAMPDADDGPAPFRERPNAPTGCRIVEEPLSRGVQFVIPPAGLRHPNVRYYFILGLGYLAVALVVGTVLQFIFDEVDDEVRKSLSLLWFVPILFGLGAIGGVEEAIRRARRQVTLTVAGDTLSVRQTSLYGTRQREWPRFRIADVRVGDTLEGRRIGPRTRRAVLDRSDPTWELHIHVKDGTIVRLLDGYGDADLQWLATALRRALGEPTPITAGGSR
jgi:hypothetical protein